MGSRREQWREALVVRRSGLASVRVPERELAQAGELPRVHSLQMRMDFHPVALRMVAEREREAAAGCTPGAAHTAVGNTAVPRKLAVDRKLAAHHTVVAAGLARVRADAESASG
jgi:hypothetical protein